MFVLKIFLGLFPKVPVFYEFMLLFLISCSMLVKLISFNIKCSVLILFFIVKVLIIKSSGSFKSVVLVKM